MRVVYPRDPGGSHYEEGMHSRASGSSYRVRPKSGGASSPTTIQKRVSGQFNQFVGVLQVECAYTREHAEEKIDRRMAEQEAHRQEVATPAR